MTPRSIRRAQERRAKKLARKVERQAVAAADAETPELITELHGFTAAPDEAALFSEPKIRNEAAPPSRPITQPSAISEAKLLANRANAQKSCGATSDSGKATSSKNALKTALTGRSVLLPTDDADRYEQHLAAYAKSFRPVGERELELVQALADNAWRLDRIPGLEEAIYFKGFNEFALQVNDLDPRTREHMLRMHTYLAYERQLRNLHIQEERLHRRRQKLLAELQELQKERDQKEATDFANAGKLYLAAKKQNKPFDPAEFGFEFSTADLECYLRARHDTEFIDRAIENARGAQIQRAQAA